MTAGTGVRHSELNAFDKKCAHLLQIWILPDRNNILPSYEEKHFDEVSKKNQWRLVASHDAREGSVLVHQDINLYATLLDKDQVLTYASRASGKVTLNGVALSAGDAMMIEVAKTSTIEIAPQSNAEMLLFDLLVADSILS